MTDRLRVLVHELRNPVAALTAIVETVGDRRSLPPEQLRRLLELALVACSDVERIAIDAVPASLRREPVDPGQLALDTAAAGALRGMDVRTEIEPGLPQLDGDPVRLRQALGNLVENAGAHSPPGAEVVVVARVRGGRIELAVADRGEGIDAHRQEAIFQPGVRFAERPGQGIGLAIARAIAEAHGGVLTVESAPGEGATFTLALPFSAAESD